MKIFISYSWHNKDIVDTIDEDWKAIGIFLIRDVRDLAFKEDIKKFMKRVTTTDHVLLILSKDYLESKNCMYEALEMLNNDKFLKKVLPIVLENANISDPHWRLKYIKYWDNQIENLNNEIMSVKLMGKIKSIQDELDRLIDIRNSIDNFINTLINLRYLSWKEAKELNYEPIFNEIGITDSNIYKEAVKIWNITDPEEQDIALEKFFQEYPNNKYSLYLKATITDKNNQKRKSKISYEKLLELYPEEYPAHILYAYLLETHFADYKHARYHYEFGLNLMPDDFNAHYRLALLIENHFKDDEAARKNYEETIRINPNHVEAYNNLGLLLTESFKEHDLAKSYFKKALQINSSNAFANYNIANLYKLHFKDYLKAKYHYEEAIKSDPNYAEAYNNLGTLLRVDFKDYENSKLCHEKALKINPNIFQAHINLAILFKEHFKDNKKAKYHLKEVSKFFGKSISEEQLDKML